VRHVNNAHKLLAKHMPDLRETGSPIESKTDVALDGAWFDSTVGHAKAK
jgi:hypothetical protein